MLKVSLFLMISLLLLSCVEQPKSTVVLNPYENIDWSSVERHKANLHTHTTESDGRFTPSEVVKMYAEAGYSVLAITDHDDKGPDKTTWPWENYDINTSEYYILPVQGNEISKANHIGSYFNDYSDGNQSSEKIAIEEIGKLDGLAVVNHPGRYRKKRNAEFYSDLYQTFDHLVGMEVVNKGDLYPDDRILYDSILSFLMPDRPVWAFSNDDFHRQKNFGTSYNIFLLPENGLQLDIFREGFKRGHFFAVYDPSSTWSKAVVPDSVVVSDSEIVVYADCDDQQIQWISEGYLVHIGKTLPLTMNLGKYVRATIIGENMAFTLVQPFGLSSLKPVKTAKLEVKNGRGSGDDYIAGAKNIRIEASQPPQGKVFESWIGKNADLIEDVRAVKTTMFLPKVGNYSIEASYRDTLP
ncbi:PHP domain-containing protein [Marinilabilia salmonicolor]|jgi:hypothetical protein|uniref:Polymerase/histidinol phosphatase N-terminal domain-containing protein n=1 Tax=Marinilabilia salmonicolor TaxID=989 RepID=A0A368V6U1_9BACT|nr:hypothetical protein [Marinilabilia salmonicolor]RCW36812.1 hypothetical protein DFO77_107103 [Marinilabilia salmonicolor]